jgi:hypothetical protein
MTGAKLSVTQAVRTPKVLPESFSQTPTPSPNLIVQTRTQANPNIPTLRVTTYPQVGILFLAGKYGQTTHGKRPI